MAKKTYEYEATIKIKVRVDEADGARVAGHVARNTMLDVRAVTYDDLYGTAKVSGGAVRRVTAVKRK
jgi:hypothetical protein